MLRRGFVILSLLAAGCTGRDAVRDMGEQARSLVRVDLSYTRQAGSAETRFDAQAHFVRYRAFDPAGVPTILGLADFDSIPLDSCRVADGRAELDEALAISEGEERGGVPAELALLDAGRLELRGPGDRALLRPHRYPELVPFVAGVSYGDDASTLSLQLGQPYQVVGEGGEEVGPFVASAMAPRAFPSLQVGPLGRAGGLVSDLDVRWADGSDGEPLRLEVKWATRQGARAVRCRVRDDGDFAVPHDAFEAMPQAAQATLTATRVARGRLFAPGVGHGELTLSLREVAALQVAP
jgi:hypothetical protein